MRHFLSYHCRKVTSGASSQARVHSRTNATSRCATSRASINASVTSMSIRNFQLTVCLSVIVLTSAFGQQPIPTSRANNSRTNSNSTETLLTPANVNKSSFGLLFSAPVDYVVMAQPLYMPNVNIPGQGVHNVVYVATQADSVYAIDADTGAQLWWVNFTNPSQGITTATGKLLPCSGVGFTQEGIIGTPVIDPNENIMYLVAKTAVNGVVQHHLHAIDITTGAEEPHSPVQIVVTNPTQKTKFNSLHQKNRPGLLWLNGVVYIGFGSNSCNDGNSGWVLSYDASTLSQLNFFNTSPQAGLTSIWQAGAGLAADENNYIYVETAEAGNTQNDIQNGGQTYNNSVIKLNPDLTVADYFTPWNVTTLNSDDFDLSSTGALVLPDQNGPTPHELIAGGKYGTVYVLDRDNMGQFNTTGSDSQIIQEVNLVQQNPSAYRDVLFGSPAFWNNTVYFAPDAAPLMAFPVLPSGMLGTAVKTPSVYSGSHSPSISASGNTNGILWVISGGLNAFDAVSLKLLYNTNQAANKRDVLQPIGHFVTQTVANGKVYVATNNSLQAYGLFYAITFTAGGAQSAPVTTALSSPIHINVSNPYTGQPTTGITVNFSDGCTKAGATTCGTFNPSSTVTDGNGNASTTYTTAQKAGTYTLTATVMVGSTIASSTTTTATATAGTPVKLITYNGTGQTGSDGFGLAKPLNALVEDTYKNGVPGVTINFTTNKGSAPNGSVVTNSTGMASYTQLQLPNTPSTVTVTAVAAPATPPVVLTPVKAVYIEYSVAPKATTVSVSSGNNQADTPGRTLPQALTVLVVDQYGNPFSGNTVTFSDNGAGGTFPNGNTGVTGSSGLASVSYTLPSSGSSSSITIDATAQGISNPAVFTENTVTPTATKMSITNGNNQSGAAGTKLPQMLTVLVVDQFGNPFSGDSVSFSDGGAGGSFPNGNTAVTGANGTAIVCYALPQTVTSVTVDATATGISGPAAFSESSVAGPAALLAITSGNRQIAPNGSQLPTALVVQVTDQYGNPVSGVSVAFSDNGAGGSFSNANPGTTASNGTVSQYYTLPAVPGETDFISATAAGISNPATFTEYGQ
jgi:hypothetical protein